MSLTLKKGLCGALEELEANCLVSLRVGDFVVMYSGLGVALQTLITCLENLLSKFLEDLCALDLGIRV
jgi:hypothetical protein